MDEVLAGIVEKVKNFAIIYCVDIGEVPDFNTMYELYDPCTCMFFFRNKHIMIDLGERLGLSRFSSHKTGYN
jgi:DIM1 family U5 snRNP protein